jgi:methoxymalonate biosynthesis acyl carrier protein
MAQQIAEKVREYILSHVDVDTLDSDTDIFETGLVNSLFAIELMTFLEQRFAIKITMSDLDMTNFNSIDHIVQFVEQKLR